MNVRPRMLLRRFPFLCVPFLCLAQQDGAVSRAIEALQRGDLPAAERILRGEVHSHPADAAALDVLGVVLDQQHEYSEADPIYRRAVAAAPRVTGVWNNYGNHLVASGKPEEARRAFLKVLALDPAHANATLQLARLAAERKDGKEALGYLDRLPAVARAGEDAAVLRMQALYLTGEQASAAAALDQLRGSGVKPARLGAALAGVGQFTLAEPLLAQSLAPGDVDALYQLALVRAALNNGEGSLALLAQASREAPARADVQRLLARVAGNLGFFGDAVQAWNRYLQLEPADEAAKRERAFAQTATGQDATAGLAELRLYAARHPGDAVGHFELGTAEAPAQPAAALRELDRALALNPDLVGARVARGLLRYRDNQPSLALPDFEYAARRDSANPAVLDRLGQTYMALDRPADAVPVLRKAAELAPRDARMQLHFGRALSAAGLESESASVMARLRDLGADQSALPRPAGLVDFLSLPAEQQMARYRAGVERAIAANPASAEAQVRYLALLLDAGEMDRAQAVQQTILSLHPPPALLREALRSWLAAGQFAAAKTFLAAALASGAPVGAFALENAIITFRSGDPQAGLDQLSQLSGGNRTAAYYSALSQMLSAVGRSAEAAQASAQAAKLTAAEQAKP